MTVSQYIEGIEACERIAARHRRFGLRAIFAGWLAASVIAHYHSSDTLAFTIILAATALPILVLKRQRRALEPDFRGLVMKLAAADDVRVLPFLAGLFKRIPGPATASALARAIERRRLRGVTPLNRRLFDDLVLQTARAPYKKYTVVTMALTGVTSTLLRPGDANQRPAHGINDGKRGQGEFMTDLAFSSEQDQR